jgi:hypothetical protein
MTPQATTPNLTLEFPGGTVIGEFFDFLDDEVYVLLHSIKTSSGRIISFVGKRRIVFSPLRDIKTIRNVDNVRLSSS